MIPSHSSEQAVLASQLLEELAAYDAGLTLLLHDGWDAEVYRTLSDRFDRMQMIAGSLPRLSVCWSELLIGRVELMHAMWTLNTINVVNGRIASLHAMHREQILALTRRCRLYLPMSLH